MECAGYYINECMGDLKDEMKATEYLKKDGSPEVDYKITQLFLESEDWVWRQGVGNEIHAPGSESRL